MNEYIYSIYKWCIHIYNYAFIYIHSHADKISEQVYSNIGKCGKEHLEDFMRLNQIIIIECVASGPPILPPGIRETLAYVSLGHTTQNQGHDRPKVSSWDFAY